MFKIIKFIIIIFIVVGIVWFIAYYTSINSSGSASDDVSLTINEGESVQDIGEALFKSGLIKSKLFFEAYIKQTGMQAKLQAGKYLIKPGLTLKEIAAKLISGDTIEQEKIITIIEGWDIKQIDAYLSEKNIILPGEFINLANNKIAGWQIENKPDYFNIAPADATLEGYLFPDTYKIFNDATSEIIIDKMLNNFISKISEDMLMEIKNNNKTLHDTIIMASIIEKEVRKPEDMALVSGIFWKRIEIGQALQSDATLAYYTGEKKARLTIEETELDTPYNTYKYPGLPPGPICNPGLNAIKAAIYPKTSEYYYFLNRQDTGETIFSKTYEEHLNNKAKYLK